MYVIHSQSVFSTMFVGNYFKVAKVRIKPTTIETTCLSMTRYILATDFYRGQNLEHPIRTLTAKIGMNDD